MRYLFGTPVMTLSEIVTDFNVEQGNQKQSHFVANMLRAKWAWKDILWNVSWSLAQQAVPVVDNKITLPKDLIRLVNLSVVDKCGNVQTLMYNPAINTLDIRCPQKSCSCATCGGDGTLCGALDSIEVTTEEVEIRGNTYTRTIYTRSDGHGNIYRISSNPTSSADEEQVEFVENREFICAVDVTESGCIKDTEPNRRALQGLCGCYLPSFGVGYPYAYTRGFCDNVPYPYSDRPDSMNPDCERTVPMLHNDYGYYNWDSVAGDVIHLKDVTATQIIVAYQTSGDGAGVEMLVPEYAVDAVKFGIMYRQKAFSPTSGMGDKQMAERDYDSMKEKLWNFNNPIRMDEWIKAQTIIPKW